LAEPINEATRAFLSIAMACTRIYWRHKAVYSL
jgi:hypothetical protein